MAFNDNDVTTLKGQLDGAIFTFPTDIDVSEIDENFDPEAAGGIYLGEVHTDGIDNEETADSNPLKVWSGRTIRNKFSNWVNTLTTNLVGKLDIDVSRALYGEENVTVNGNTVRVAHGLRQPKVRPILIRATADDGRKQWLFAPRAQPDINISETWNEEDVVSLAVAWGLLEDANGKTNYQFTTGQSS